MSELYPSDDIRYPEAALVSDALDALADKFLIPIEAKWIGASGLHSGLVAPDALVELKTAHGTIQYFAECKLSIDRKSQIDQLIRRHASAGIPRLLFTTYLSKELASHCRATGLQFIDASGNAYLNSPGLFVFITGEKRESARPARAPKGLTNVSALRVLFALLARPALVNATLTDISDHAGVSLGTVHNTLGDLEQRGYLLNARNADRRKVLERERLLEEWAINYPTTLRPKLEGRRFSAPDPDWWKDAGLERLPVTWGAEVAAMKMTSHLKPGTQTLYIQPSDLNQVLLSLVKQHHLRPDAEGDVEIFEQFWHWKADDAHLAPPLLVYAELNALLDPRAQETARMIKENFIDFAPDQERSPA